MRSLAQVFATATQAEASPQEPAEGFQIVAFQPAMEGFAEQLGQALPERTVTVLQFPELNELSQESQQQEQSEVVEDLKQQYEDLLDLLNPKEPVNNVQVFLLDEEGMVSGAAGSAAALKAMLKRSLNGSHKVVAALSQSWKAPGSALPEGVSAMAMEANTKVLKKYLSVNGIVTVESFDELSATLAAL